MKLRAWHAVLAGLFVTLSPAQADDCDLASSFTLDHTVTITGGVPGIPARSMDQGDVDGDGDLDIIAAFAGRIYVLLNDGNGGFADTGVWYGGGSIMPEVRVSLADLNGDGHLDIADAGSLQGNVRLGDGTGSFGDPLTGFINIPAWNGGYAAAAGDFDGDGDGDVAISDWNLPQIRIYRNDCPAAPRITAQPAPSVVTDPGGMVSLHVAAAGATGYQWRRNGVPLADDARITGSATDTLEIAGARPTDTDTYDVVVTTGDGDLTSNPSVVAVRTTCPADLAEPWGLLDLSDVLGFVESFLDGCQ
ncbi:MAG: VCBS repeat-containing protein [Phycisphaeraceae bacterium]|nr:MAG: VCBS repeat-containing protein [Phycisphaeraceae bacterium]